MKYSLILLYSYGRVLYNMSVYYINKGRDGMLCEF